MDTDDLEPVNEWCQPKQLGRMRERSGGTLYPQSNPPVTARPAGWGRTHNEYGRPEPYGFSVDNLPVTGEVES
jgi:hypothetical protein